MIPSIEGSILLSNPNFASLHRSLTKTILNVSGSTKHDHAQKERDAISQALKSVRKHAAKLNLLMTALALIDISSAPTPSNSKQEATRRKAQYEPLPQELLEMILLFSDALTDPPFLSSSKGILDSTDQWNAISIHIPHIGSLVSAHIQNQALALVRIVSPNTNSSFIHRGIPKLVSSVNDLQQGNHDREASLQTRRTRLVGNTKSLLKLYSFVLSLIIGILEQTKHGSVARYIKAKVEFFSLAALSVELKSVEKNIKGHNNVYTEEIVTALDNYMLCLSDGKERGGERKREMERILWGYGVGREEVEKERIMREIARVYMELDRELTEVGRDVERLKVT